MASTQDVVAVDDPNPRPIPTLVATNEEQPKEYKLSFTETFMLVLTLSVRLLIVQS